MLCKPFNGRIQFSFILQRLIETFDQGVEHNPDIMRGLKALLVSLLVQAFTKC